MLHLKINQLMIETFPIGTLGCNCSLVYDEQTREAYAIDAGNDATHFFEEVEKRGLNLRAIYYTHAHFDHIGSAFDIAKKFPQCPLYLHQEDEWLNNALPQQALMFAPQMNLQATSIKNFLHHEEYYGDLGTSHTNLKNIHTPGHTPGSCSFYLENTTTPILFSGDTLFKNSIGRTDLPGGDFVAIKKSIKERLYTLESETLVIPGHGPTTVLREEKKTNPYISQ